MKQAGLRKRPKKRGRRKIYQGEVVVVLEQIWEICGRICSKRLQPFLPEMVKVLERTGELQISAETKTLLVQMSRPTIDRCLLPTRRTHPHGLSTTKPGTLLKKAIPVRTHTPWDEEKPGFLEIDLVAHLRRDKRRPVREHFDLYGCLHGLDRVPGGAPPQQTDRFRSHPDHAHTSAFRLARP